MNALKLNRILRGLSQDALARASGVSQSTYSRIERGARRPRPEERVRIASALGSTPDVVFESARSPVRTDSAEGGEAHDSRRGQRPPLS